MSDQSSYDKGLEAGLKCRAMLVPHPIPWQPHPVPADAEPGSEWNSWDKGVGIRLVIVDGDDIATKKVHKAFRPVLGSLTAWCTPGTVGTHCCRITTPEGE